jgi:hypothetical protein
MVELFREFSPRALANLLRSGTNLFLHLRNAVLQIGE